MQRPPRNLPAELDFLESPLMSPAMPSGVSLGPVPGSALAERIFNDPESWETEDLDEDGAVDPMAWFIEEVERFRLNSAASSATAFSSETEMDSDRDLLSDDDDEDEDGLDELDKVAFAPSSASSEDAQRDGSAPKTGLKGIKRKSATLRPISLTAFFEHSGTDLPEEVQLQLAKIIESGGLAPAFGKGISPASSLSTTPSTGSSSSSSTAATDPSSASPVNVHSASATLSFLEWYGIYPDTPASAASFRKSIYANARKARNSPGKLSIPKSAAPSLTRQNSLLSPSVLMPDLRVEPPKRGSGVPPLERLKPMLDQIVVQASAPPETETNNSVETSALDVEVEVQPANPPGLDRPEPKLEAPSVVTPTKSEASKPATPPPAVAPEAPAVPSTSSSSSKPSTPAKAGLLTNPSTPTSTPPRRKPSPAAARLAPQNKSRSTTPSGTPPSLRGLGLPPAFLETARRRPTEIKVRDTPPPYSRQTEGPSTAGPGGSHQRAGSRLDAPAPVTAAAHHHRLPSTGTPDVSYPRSAVPQHVRTPSNSTSESSSNNQLPTPAPTPNGLRRLPSIPPSVPPPSAGPGLGASGIGLGGLSTTPPTGPAAKLSTLLQHRPALVQSKSAAVVSSFKSSLPSAAAPPLPSALPSAMPSAMPSSIPSGILSPEMTPTHTWGGRPMSTVRSPMGPVGPRLRAAGPRPASGLSRRPPVLQL